MKKYVALFLFVFMTAGIYAQSVVINKKWLEYDVTQNGVKGMKIHVDFNVEDMKGKQGEVIVYFEYPKGTGLKDTNGSYCTEGGHVCVSEKFTPRYDNSHYSDFGIFMPLNEIHMKKGKLTYYCDIRFYDLSSRQFLNDNTYLSFVGTSQGENISNNNNANSNGSGYTGRRWREDAGWGMFYDCRELNGGAVSKTLYGRCIACRGSALCGSCYGNGICNICNGNGGIITSGYGNYLACTACYQTGKCNLCKGTGKCVCSNYEFPGYTPGSNALYSADGTIISTTSYRSGGGSTSRSSSSSSSSSGSSRSSCSRCGGTGVDPSIRASGGLSAWIAYHNSQGTKCPYCGAYSSHGHDKCSSCNVPR